MALIVASASDLCGMVAYMWDATHALGTLELVINYSAKLGALGLATHSLALRWVP